MKRKQIRVYQNRPGTLLIEFLTKHYRRNEFWIPKKFFDIVK